MDVIIFFDGACGLCDRTVRWLWGRTRPEVRFAPLQGATAEAQIPLALRTPPLQSLVVWDGHSLQTEVEALAAVAHHVEGLWGVALRLLTSRAVSPLTRWVYRRVVRNRHRWFGAACDLPADRDRLLP